MENQQFQQFPQYQPYQPPAPERGGGFKDKLRQVHELLSKKNGLGYIILAVVIAASTAAGLIWYMESNQPKPSSYTVTKPQPKKEAPKFYSPLTGVEVPDEAITKRQVTAVMIENSPDARPQSGLKDAGVVFEAIAEGGITRFIALYQEARPELIGPVRSVRPYYVEWAAAFDAGVAHVGGSRRALDMIRSGNYGVDLDQFFNSGAYWRATDRYAPHNVYSSFDRLDALTSAKGKTSSTFAPFLRTQKKITATPNATNINVGVSSGKYNIDYVYDGTTNTYTRKQGGEIHMDREKGNITPSVVIAIHVNQTIGFEDGNREQITTTGSGDGYVFQNGTVTKVTWTKTEAKGQISFLDEAGKNVELIPGQTWVTAVANGKNISWQ